MQQLMTHDLEHMAFDTAGAAYAYVSSGYGGRITDPQHTRVAVEFDEPYPSYLFDIEDAPDDDA